MPRIFILLAASLLILSLGLGIVAHGAETLACEDGVSASSVASHNDADDSSDPDDSGKAAHHQHGGCHGHQSLILTGAAVHGPHLETAGALMPLAITCPITTPEVQWGRRQTEQVRF